MDRAKNRLRRPKRFEFIIKIKLKLTISLTPQLTYITSILNYPF